MSVASPTPDIPHTPSQPKRVLWKWSLVITAVIAVFLAWQCGSGILQGQKLASVAVQHFHEQLNAGRYEDIYQEATEGFRGGSKREELVKFLTAVHAKLGNAGAPSAGSINVNATPGGTFVTTQYNTKFEKGDATETFTWLKTAGTLKLQGYNIQSNALILN